MAISLRVLVITALALSGIPAPASGQVGVPGRNPWPQEAFTLDDLLRMARERHPDLLALRAEREALEADRRDAGRFHNPELELATGEGDPFEGTENRSLRDFRISQTIENPVTRYFRQGAQRKTVEAADEAVPRPAIPTPVVKVTVQDQPTRGGIA